MQRKIVLASKSPRRRDLLRQIGLENFEIRESEYQEDMSAKNDPFELVKFLALEKTKDVARHYDDAIIIGGDSIVAFEEKFIGKPKDEEDARSMLRSFSGKQIVAISGFAIIDTKSGETASDSGSAKVTFKKLSEEEIDNYVATGEPLEMAGAFGLMNRAAVFAESVNGDFYSIIGLPVNKVYLELKKMGVNVLR